MNKAIFFILEKRKNPVNMLISSNADQLNAQWPQKLFDHFVIFQVLVGKLLYLMQKKIFLYLLIPTHSCKYLQLQGSEESK